MLSPPCEGIVISPATIVLGHTKIAASARTTQAFNVPSGGILDMLFVDTTTHTVHVVGRAFIPGSLIKIPHLARFIRSPVGIITAGVDGFAVHALQASITSARETFFPSLGYL
jgi:hypothetical protein